MCSSDLEIMRTDVTTVGLETATLDALRLMRRLRNAQDCIGEHRDTLLAAHWVQSTERLLGRDLAARVVVDLERRERMLRLRAAKRSRKVLVSWRDWRDATRRVRKAAKSGRA